LGGFYKAKFFYGLGGFIGFCLFWVVLMSFATKALRREGFFFSWLCFEKVSKAGDFTVFFIAQSRYLSGAKSQSLFFWGGFFLLLTNVSFVNYCPSPDGRENPFVVGFTTKDWKDSGK